MFIAYLTVVAILNAFGFDFSPLIEWFQNMGLKDISGWGLFWFGFVIAVLVD